MLYYVTNRDSFTFNKMEHIPHCYINYKPQTNCFKSSNINLVIAAKYDL